FECFSSVLRRRAQRLLLPWLPSQVHGIMVGCCRVGVSLFASRVQSMTRDHPLVYANPDSQPFTPASASTTACLRCTTLQHVLALGVNASMFTSILAIACQRANLAVGTGLLTSSVLDNWISVGLILSHAVWRCKCVLEAP